MTRKLAARSLGFLFAIVVGLGVAIPTVVLAQTPPMAADATFAVNVGVAFPESLVPLASGGATPYGFTVVTAVSKGILALDSATGDFTYTAGAGQSGSDSFEWMLTDFNGREDTGTITFTIVGPPVAADAPFSVAYQGVLNQSLAPLASGGATPYGFSVVATVSKGILALDTATGAFTYTAGPGQTGSDSFEWMLTDFNGREDTGIITIEIGAPPIAVQSVDVSVVAGESVDVDITSLISGGTAPFNPFVAIDGSKGSTSVNGLVFTYTANAAERGADVVEFKVPDSGNPVQTGSAQINITILAPELVANDLNITLAPGQTFNGDLSGEVSGGVPPYAFGLGSQGSQGTASVAVDGTFSFIANANAVGTDQFTYTVIDSEPGPTGAAETTGTVFVTFSAQATEPPASPPPGTFEPTPEPTSVSTSPTPATPITTLPSTGAGNGGGSQMLVFLIGFGIALMILATGIWRRQGTLRK